MLNEITLMMITWIFFFKWRDMTIHTAKGQVLSYFRLTVLVNMYFLVALQLKTMLIVFIYLVRLSKM